MFRGEGETDDGRETGDRRGNGNVLGEMGEKAKPWLLFHSIIYDSTSTSIVLLLQIAT